MIEGSGMNKSKSKEKRKEHYIDAGWTKQPLAVERKDEQDPGRRKDNMLK
jgi:hypothetical protein